MNGHQAASRSRSKQGYYSPSVESRPRKRIPIFPIAAVIVLAAVGIAAAAFTSSPSTTAVLDLDGGSIAIQDAQSGTSGAQAGQVAVTSAYKATPADVQSMPSSKGIEGFDMAGDVAVTLTQGSLDRINEALAPFAENEIPVGFVFENLETGKGISSNIDEVVYGASSIKGPFVTYVFQEQIDGGNVSLTDSYASYNDNFQSNGSATVKSLATQTIEQSANGTFMALRKGFGGSNYAAWLTSLGVDPDIHEDGGIFAWYSARDAAKMWTDVYNYLDEGTETSNLLYGLMGNTNESWIRNGLDSLAGSYQGDEWKMPTGQPTVSKLISACADSVTGYQNATQVLENATVVNKAGWCASDAGEGTKYDSVSDNGIVTIDGEDYLLCIMSGARYSDRNVDRVSGLAEALLSTYSELR